MFNHTELLVFILCLQYCIMKKYIDRNNVEVSSSSLSHGYDLYPLPGNAPGGGGGGRRPRVSRINDTDGEFLSVESS